MVIQMPGKQVDLPLKQYESERNKYYENTAADRRYLFIPDTLFFISRHVFPLFLSSIQLLFFGLQAFRPECSQVAFGALVGT